MSSVSVKSHIFFIDCLLAEGLARRPFSPVSTRRVSTMTLGGISKASKGINLSEDIFGGFNFVLRGGKATQAEYIQVMITPSLPRRRAANVCHGIPVYCDLTSKFEFYRRRQM